MKNSDKFWFFLLCGLLSFPLAAQTTPDEVVQAYYQRLQREDYASLREILHPDSMAELKAMMLPVYALEEEAGTRDVMNRTFGTSTLYRDLIDMDAAEFFAGFSNLMQRQVGQSRLNLLTVEVVGSVIEGIDRHVVARTLRQSGQVTLTRLEVVSVRPYGADWRVLLNGEWVGIADALRAGLQLP